MDITIKELQKDFGKKRAININQCTIKSGTLLGLVGNNGAGKTTLFRLMTDLLKADKGEILIGDTNPAQSEVWKNHTGVFIDESFLIDYLTPEEFFYFTGRIYGLGKEVIDERLVPFNRFMNGEVLGQKKLIRNYSMGNKQKIGIIAAMLHHPQVLILDEPFNFLDPTSQSVIRQLLKNYNDETGATIFISSHNLTHTTDICPRIILLEDGHILRDINNTDNQAVKELETYFEI